MKTTMAAYWGLLLLALLAYLAFVPIGSADDSWQARTNSSGDYEHYLPDCGCDDSSQNGDEDQDCEGYDGEEDCDDGNGYEDQECDAFGNWSANWYGNNEDCSYYDNDEQCSDYEDEDCADYEDEECYDDDYSDECSDQDYGYPPYGFWPGYSDNEEDCSDYDESDQCGNDDFNWEHADEDHCEDDGAYDDCYDDSEDDECYDEEDDGSCTLPPQYWATFNADAEAPYNQAWPISEDSQLCGQRWVDLLTDAAQRAESGTPYDEDQDSRWNLLAVEWIAAKLSIAAGNVESDYLLNALLEQAEGILNQCEIAEEDDAAAYHDWSVLYAWNSGGIGPGMCCPGEEPECPPVESETPAPPPPYEVPTPSPNPEEPTPTPNPSPVAQPTPTPVPIPGGDGSSGDGDSGDGDSNPEPTPAPTPQAQSPAPSPEATPTPTPTSTPPLAPNTGVTSSNVGGKPSLSNGDGGAIGGIIGGLVGGVIVAAIVALIIGALLFGLLKLSGGAGGAGGAFAPDATALASGTSNPAYAGAGGVGTNQLYV